MACPHVAGALALAKSRYPSATPHELKDCLFESAQEIESLNDAKYEGGLGAGLLDVYQVSKEGGECNARCRWL